MIFEGSVSPIKGSGRRERSVSPSMGSTLPMLSPDLSLLSVAFASAVGTLKQQTGCLSMSNVSAVDNPTLR